MGKGSPERGAKRPVTVTTSRISALLVREGFTSVLHIMISLTTVMWD